MSPRRTSFLKRARREAREHTDGTRDTPGTVERPRLPILLHVPEHVINDALAFVTGNVEELDTVRIDVHDGYFNLHIEGRNFVSFVADIRFEITGAELTGKTQTVVLRQIGKTKFHGSGLLSRPVVAAARLAYFRKSRDPMRILADRTDGIAVVDDFFGIDLGVLGVEDYLERNENFRAVVSICRVNEIRCEEGRFEIVPELEIGPLLARLKNRAGEVPGNLEATRIETMQGPASATQT